MRPAPNSPSSSASPVVRRGCWCASGGEVVVGDVDWPGPPPWDRRPTFALDADVTVYWPEVRPCWEEARDD